MTKTHNEQEGERVKERGGGRQSLKHVDGDVPVCMCNKDEDVGMKSKKTEADIVIVTFEGYVTMCMRRKV